MNLGLRILADIGAIFVMSGFCFLLVKWLKRSGGRLERAGYNTLLIIGILWVSIGILGLMVSFVTDINVFMAEPFLVTGLAPLILGLIYRYKRKRIMSKEGND